MFSFKITPIMLIYNLIKGGIRMLKKLVPVLALTGLAFGSGLCFNPYNHDYGISTEQILDPNLSNYNKTIILHNGKMQVDKDTNTMIKLVRYVVNNNKALILLEGVSNDFPTEYFIVYTKCINEKPVTLDIETLGDPGQLNGVANLPKYPMKFGFYKDGFWAKYLAIDFQNGWYHHPGGYSCDYETQYFPYKLIKEGKGYEGPSKDQYLPFRACMALVHKLGMD